MAQNSDLRISIANEFVGRDIIMSGWLDKAELSAR